MLFSVRPFPASTANLLLARHSRDQTGEVARSSACAWGVASASKSIRNVVMRASCACRAAAADVPGTARPLAFELLDVGADRLSTISTTGRRSSWASSATSKLSDVVRGEGPAYVSGEGRSERVGGEGIARADSGLSQGEDLLDQGRPRYSAATAERGA